ncbi:MAG: TIGR03668 family PPOX class F420-dependent oxidoreductase [Candidatus Limnocylindrales bacterium]
MPALTDAQRTLLATARRAVLATLAPDGRADLVPICYLVRELPGDPGGLVVYSALDEKPKRGADPYQLSRVRNLVARPTVTLLIDHWAEDWARLAWLRLEGLGQIVDPPPAGSPEPNEHEAAIAGLRARYPQYRTQRLEGRPLLRIAVTRVVAWSATT